ncbi:hypothetical protein C1E23_07740 [Pseudoalteromonas phenolica]|uniref:Uncharacterized protein n=1 Tax=Pseudoalteromonas phenolica TaxID=161398 RepID=A0A4Q7IQA6_9GAMM|nr:hypothetical protein [Pseudoalteromonas phenolica]RZQ53749.1 hypothetical protein C1E23_07740 [Pseudoalteromonas phenolica]
MTDYDHAATGKIYSLVIDITDLEQRVKEMQDVALDTSWLDELDVIDRLGYEARSKRTVEKITNEILNNVESDISEDFGEYMVSDVAQTALKEHLDHIRLPLAEFIKEKISGNPGFDFHTESPETLVAFGEAKYSGVQNAHGRALKQINEFIVDQKDIQELPDLRKFVTEGAIQNAAAGTKAYSAAFSITSDDIGVIMDNALNSVHMKTLLSYDAIYLIGVKISA